MENINIEISEPSASDWTEGEIEKLSDVGFEPHYGDKDDYRREVSYGDVIYDTAYKSSPESYDCTKYHKEGDRFDYDWVSESEEFKDFDSLISFLREE